MLTSHSPRSNAAVRNVVGLATTPFCNPSLQFICSLFKIVKERTSYSVPHYVMKHILLNSGRGKARNIYFVVVERLQRMLSEGIVY